MRLTRATELFFPMSLALLLLADSAGAAVETNRTEQTLPLQIMIGQPLPSEDENRIAEVEGTVSFVGQQGAGTELELSSGAGRMQVNVAEVDEELARLLLRSRVRVRGVCIGIRNAANGEIVASLSVAGLRDCVVLQAVEEAWRRYPLRTVASSTNVTGSLSPRGIIHLHGKMQTADKENIFRLADSTGAVDVHCGQALSKPSGTEVELLGRVELEGDETIFRSAVCRVISKNRRQVSALPLLRTTDQIRWLKPEEANRGYPVRLRGVVTFLLGTNREAAGNLQDGTGGIYVWHMAASAAGTTVRPGDFCEVEGETSAGEFSPGINCRKLTILGAGDRPEPVRPTWRELAGGGLDAQWVELEGVVLSATNQHLEVGTQSGRITCFVSDGSKLERFLDAVVRIRGAVVAERDQARHIQRIHLNIPSDAFISVETAAADDPFSLPTRRVKDLLFYNPGESDFHREKISGQIIGMRDGVCYLMDGKNGLRFISKNNSGVAPGDLVDAVGFPEIDNVTETPLITLREAIVRVTGEKPLPSAAKITPSDLFSGEYDSTLVRVEARLIHIGVYEGEQVMELQRDARTFFARLNTAVGRIQQYPSGSLLEITGVDVFNGKANAPAEAGSVELLLNAPAGVRVLELPSWWTGPHALIVVSVMTAVILLGVVWIASLRQQVARRTTQLSVANTSLKNEIVERKRMENELVQTRLQHLVEQERTRIARDIHDELGCNLSEIRLLSEMTLSRERAPSEIQFNANRISAKALETTRVLDEIVWAVDPKNDTLESLLNYLFTFASDYLSLAGIRFRIDAPTKIPHHALTTQVRHQLYMTVKETFTNIVNHAKATEVSMHVQLDDGAAWIIIEDNGRGFSLAADPKAEATVSGLTNMRKRFNEIGGEFVLDSVPDRGTCVKFKFPLNGATTL